MAVLWKPILCFPVILVCIIAQCGADEIDQRLQVISKSGPNGVGAAEARQAAQELAAEGIVVLPQVLRAMDTENVVAANWYRTIYEQIVREELNQSASKFPLETLHAFVKDAQHAGRPRRLVLSLLDRLEPEFRDAFIPSQLDDREFRNDAVASLLKTGESAQKAGDLDIASELYQQAFEAARESGQIQAAAAKLKSVGRAVNIIDHMGFVIDWHLIGPFDAPDKSGFDTSFPPEQRVDLQASYAGQGGGQISWKRHQTGDSLGLVNLASAIAPVKEAVGYAYAEVNSPRDQAVQVRCGADDNLTVWINDEKVFARQQWLNGTRLDRFTAAVHLRKGKNTILVKVCQGPQHKNPAVGNNWSMQLRLCDENGGSVGVRSALPSVENITE